MRREEGRASERASERERERERERRKEGNRESEDRISREDLSSLSMDPCNVRPSRCAPLCHIRHKRSLEEEENKKKIRIASKALFVSINTYMTGTKHTVRSSRRDAGVIGGSAIARVTRPAGIADALTTFAGTVARTKHTQIPLAREVVALAERSGYLLLWIFSFLTMALAAGACAATRTIYEGSIVRPT